ncbi:MAG: hypothetical protein ACOC4G_02220 [Bacillota bacterium]
MFFLFLLLVSLLVLVNHNYLKEFLNNYKEEIELMKRINPDNNLQRLPIMITNIIFHLISIVFSWILMYLIYKNILGRYISNYVDHSLVNFQFFRGSLLIYLLIPGLIISVLMGYLTFWSKYS